MAANILITLPGTHLRKSIANLTSRLPKPDRTELGLRIARETALRRERGPRRTARIRRDAQRRRCKTTDLYHHGSGGEHIYDEHTNARRKAKRETKIGHENRSCSFDKPRAYPMASRDRPNATVDHLFYTQNSLKHEKSTDETNAGLEIQNQLRV